jgi:plasmid stabilization system protein ParE
MSLPRLTEQAKADLDEIWLQIALDDVLVADRFIDRVLSRRHLLADRPKMAVSGRSFEQGCGALLSAAI